MFCTHCGAHIAETAQFCTGCGAALTALPAQAAPVYTPSLVNTAAPPANLPPPQPQYQAMQQQININVPPAQSYTTKWANMRLVVGIISIVFTILMQFHACAGTVAEVIDESREETASSAGVAIYFLSFFFLAAGLISAFGRKSRGAAIAAGCMYGLFALLALNLDYSTETGLEIWYMLDFVFAALMIISGIAEKKRPRKHD